jgi:hypothetical protein
VQLLNRVGWDGIIRKPDANELGWKDTVRVSPLEDTIVALRPVVPFLGLVSLALVLVTDYFRKREQNRVQAKLTRELLQLGLP